ncbi:hypothetical protein E3J79_02075 [Candidatus Dependentiae bacterium]|nr:MAG: hypothetical protein E3J79_02075 [Candidatus Dependentiae bacterium]
MKVNSIKKIMFCLLFTSSVVLLSVQTKGAMAAALPVSDNQIQERVQNIVKDAQSLLNVAKDCLIKLCEGSYAKDGWTFKDFVWAFKGLAKGLDDKVLRPLKLLKVSVAGDSSWCKVLSMIQLVADEFYKRLTALSNDLHPYERTKNGTNSYKIAKIFENHVNVLLACIEKLKASLNEAILILTKRFGNDSLSEELTKFKELLENLVFAGKRDIGFVSRIIGRIKHN